jgi:chemotaxis protein CheD
MNAPREIQVHMGQLALGSGADVLRATLGSCVGIGLLWRERALYGLAHCLLPDAPRRAGTSAASGASGASGTSAAKYVTDALPSLLALMQVPHAAHHALEAVLAGGANMVHYPCRPLHAPIGEQNAQTARRLLDALGVRVIHQDVGGECGRQIWIDCAQHAFTVKTIGRPL